MMLPYNSPINKQIVAFLKKVSGGMNVYNLSNLTTKPNNPNRIEFIFDNFVSTGQIYQQTKETPTQLFVSSIAEYRCELTIRVLADPINYTKIVNKICGAIQTNVLVDDYVPDIYIINSSLNTDTFRIQKDNIITLLGQINVECYVAIAYDDTEISYVETIDTDLYVDDKFVKKIIRAYPIYNMGTWERFMKRMTSWKQPAIDHHTW